MNAPALSVRVLTHNYGPYLTQCLESVLAQTFEDFEVIVIDDASSDDSFEIATGFAARDSRVRAVRQDVNRGFLGSLLHSIELSRGRYEMQLDADDWIVAPDALEALVGMMDANPDMAFCFSPYAIHDAAAELQFVAPPFDRDVVLPGEEAIATVMRFTVPHSGTVVRMSAYRQVGGYDVSYPYGADMALFYGLCAVGDVGYVNRPLIGYRNHGSNMSLSSRWKIVYDDSVRAVESVFAGPLGSRIVDAPRVRRQALRVFLHHHATQLIFSGRAKEGWRLLGHHARRKPILTLVQPNTARLLVRTVLGERGYERARRLGRR